MEYKVIKQHWGDKQYFEGDTREVKVDSDAKELVRMGLIVESDSKEEKSAPKAKNKMAKEPANKSE